MVEVASPSVTTQKEIPKGTITINLFVNKILCDFQGDIKGRDINIVVGQLIKQYRIWKMKLAKEKK